MEDYDTDYDIDLEDLDDEDEDDEFDEYEAAQSLDDQLADAEIQGFDDGNMDARLNMPRYSGLDDTIPEELKEAYEMGYEQGYELDNPNKLL